MSRALVALTALLCAHCATVRGNGVAGAQTRELAAFTGVQNETSVDAHITIGPVQSVRVACDQNLLDRINTRVNGDMLVLDFPANTSIAPVAPCSVDITMPALTAAVLQGSGGIIVARTETSIALARVVSDGSGTIDVGAPIAASELTSTNSGSGDTHLRSFDGNSSSLVVDGSGSTTIDSGHASRLQANLDGSGDVHAPGLTASDCAVTIDGSGSATLQCTHSLDAHLNGSGSAIISGAPAQHSEQIGGSGSVVYR